MTSIYANFLEQKKAFPLEKSSTPTGLVWDTNMAAHKVDLRLTWAKVGTSETKMTACKTFDLDDHSENYGGCEESITRSSEAIYDKKKKLPKKHYLSHLVI